MEIDYNLACFINMALVGLLIITQCAAMRRSDDKRWYLAARLSWMAAAIFALYGPGPSMDLWLDWERAGDPDVEIAGSTRIAAFTQRQASELEVDANMTNVFVYKRAHEGAWAREESSYVVYEDTYGDGGMELSTYDADAARIYQDATAEDARVEDVSIVYTKKARWLGLTLAWKCPREREVRIHVPEGTLAIEGGLAT